MKFTNDFLKKLRTSNKQKISALHLSPEMLDKKALSAIIGRGTKYSFDANGVLVNSEMIEGDNDIISINGSTMTVSGCLGLETSDIEGPQSGVSFTGEAVDSGVFKFFADNTDVEWAYCFTEGQSGGYLGTSNLQHEVSFPGSYNYDCVMHNHSQQAEYGGISQNDINELNSRPSEQDLSMLSGGGFSSGIIYSESDGKFYSYTESSKTQEDLIEEKEWEIEMH